MSHTAKSSITTIAFALVCLGMFSAPAYAQKKCDADAGECKSQDSKRKNPEDSYPGCLSTQGGPGCQGKTPNPPLPPKSTPPIELPPGGGGKNGPR